jgi:DNA-binding CsgD family transcriptional regulator
MLPDVRLSKREYEVIKLVLQGQGNKQIARALDISIRTVEFHLKNIYTKFQVNSRVELILKLGHSTGSAITEKLGYPTVGRLAESTENRDRPNLQTGWAKSFRGTVSLIGQELGMKTSFNPKHVFVGLAAALGAGVLLAALWLGSGNLPMLRTASLPMLILLPILGLIVGWVGKQNGNTLRQVFFSAFAGAIGGLLTVIPLIIMIVLPIGKLAAALGLIDPATMPGAVASSLAHSAATLIWLVAGTLLGMLFLLAAKKLPRMNAQEPPVVEPAHSR